MNRRSSSSRLPLAFVLAAVLCLALALAVGGCGSGSSSSSSTSAATEKAPSTSTATSKSAGEKPSDESIQGYGDAAKGGDKAAVTAAVHGFLTAMADRDFAAMCEDLAASNREELAAFGKGESSGSAGCVHALKTLLSPGLAEEARAAAVAPVTSVRIKGDNAFAIFTPKGGAESFLVVKREGDGWKAISVTPGTPLDPSASQ